MDRVVHTSEGKLLVGDPFKIVGTKLIYKSGAQREGVVTKRALEHYNDSKFSKVNSRVGDRAPVWASWGGFDSDFEPTYVEKSCIISVETP